jgi:hypothetical protein
MGLKSLRFMGKDESNTEISSKVGFRKTLKPRKAISADVCRPLQERVRFASFLTEWARKYMHILKRQVCLLRQPRKVSKQVVQVLLAFAVTVVPF